MTGSNGGTISIVGRSVPTVFLKSVNMKRSFRVVVGGTEER